MSPAQHLVSSANFWSLESFTWNSLDSHLNRSYLCSKHPASKRASNPKLTESLCRSLKSLKMVCGINARSEVKGSDPTGKFMELGFFNEFPMEKAKHFNYFMGFSWIFHDFPWFEVTLLNWDESFPHIGPQVNMATSADAAERSLLEGMVHGISTDHDVNIENGS